jgi:hypothetical protein
MANLVIYNKLDNAFTFNCPHCDNLIQVLGCELACCIFRHAAYTHSLQQINPHTPEQECKRLVKEKLVIGCAKPFKFVNGNPSYVTICDYI